MSPYRFSGASYREGRRRRGGSRVGVDSGTIRESLSWCGLSLGCLLLLPLLLQLRGVSTPYAAMCCCVSRSAVHALHTPEAIKANSLSLTSYVVAAAAVAADCMRAAAARRKGSSCFCCFAAAAAAAAAAIAAAAAGTATGLEGCPLVFICCCCCVDLLLYRIGHWLNVWDLRYIEYTPPLGLNSFMSASHPAAAAVAAAAVAAAAAAVAACIETTRLMVCPC